MAHDTLTYHRIVLYVCVCEDDRISIIPWSLVDGLDQCKNMQVINWIPKELAAEM